jgi:predicted nucleic acid-binding protein
MTADTIPTDPSVLNTTVLSNFAAIDRIDLVAGLAGICAVPEVEHELDAGIQTHPYLRPALDALHDTIPVAPISETVANREDVLRSHLDPGEAQAFALADTHDGSLLTILISESVAITVLFDVDLYIIEAYDELSHYQSDTE